MNNGKEVPNFLDPLPQAKRARLDGTMGTVSTSGLSKANSLPQYSQDKSLPYRHTYLSYGQEPLDFPSAWSPSRIFVRNGQSPLVLTTATEGSITTPIISCKHEHLNFPEDNRSPTVPEDIVAKQTIGYRPSEHNSSSAELPSAASFRKKTLSSYSPSPAEKSGGIAIPKPVYGRSPCCAGQKCTVGCSYTLDQGLQRMPRPIFEDSLTYSHWACMQKKESEALMQQRLLPFEHCAEGVPLKRVATKDYHGLSPSKRQRFSAFSEPCQSKYMYKHVHPHGPFSPERCQHFQMSRPMHKDLVPMYEPVPGMQYGTNMQIYQDCPLTFKYREIPQHSLHYCPKNNINVYSPENLQQSSGMRPILQPFCQDFKSYYPVFTPVPPVVRNIPAYHVHRTDLDTRDMIPSAKRPFSPPGMHQAEQPMDFSMQREQNSDFSQKQAVQGQLGIKGNSREINPHGHCVASNNADAKTPSLDSACQGEGLFNSHNDKAFADTFGNIPSKKHKVETDCESCEKDSLVKPQMIQNLKATENKHTSSPPMPVINKVFSLAPYKAYLTGVMSPVQDPSHPVLSPDLKPLKDDAEAQNSDPNLDEDVIKRKLKPQKLEFDDGACQSEKDSNRCVVSQNNRNVSVEGEQDNLESEECDSKHGLVMRCDAYCRVKSVPPEMTKHPPVYSMMEGVALPTDIPAKPPIPIETNQAVFPFVNIPSHCLANIKIILPKVLKTPMSPVPRVPQAAFENHLPISKRQARYQFMELHQSLCRLVSGCISQASNCELKNWVSSLDLDESASPPAKTPKVSCLLGSKVSEVWIKYEQIVKALQKVLRKLENYVQSQECPFPHVIRAGAIFIPMLVVKELLFPHVHGTFIDQVLQEHRVELRPTTLSEERQLTQLHKRAFSSKLRRLMSLKHLPDIYPDVLNLLYYAGVCKYLGIEVNPTIKQECTPCFAEAESTFSGFEVPCISPGPHMPDTTSCQKCFQSAGRVKDACKRFLEHNTSFPEETGPDKETESWTFTNCLGMEEWANGPENVCVKVEAQTEVKLESDIEAEPANSWGCPLTADDLSSESTDADTEQSSLSSYAKHTPSSIKRHSDMVLKLRKVYYTKGRRGQVSHYQRVSEHSEVQRRRHRKQTRRSSETSLRHKLRKLSRSQRRTYLSTPRPTAHRRRWVLRSAAQNHPQTAKNRYPDLVGKRIRHLYEENDKTEVWYKGVVLRIHESHPNPLKTVFEVKYDSEPEWQYYLELLVDYKKGWLQIEE